MTVADWFSSLISGPAAFAGPDQGLDFTGTGTVHALGHGIVTAINPNYQFRQGTGQQIVYKLTSGPAAGRFVYTNEALRVNPSLKIGSILRPGSVLGSFSSSFPGIETGFAQGAQGGAYGNPDEGKTGPADPQAYAFKGLVSGNASLTKLWVQAGGSPKVANIMAAIALAESGGQVAAKGGPNSDGTYDYGIWQINSSHKQFDANRLTSDPLYNARAAVSVYKSQGFTAWSTYNSGAYQQFMASAKSAGYGLTRPGGDSTQGVTGGATSGGGGGGGTSGDTGNIDTVLRSIDAQSSAVPPLPQGGVQTTSFISHLPGAKLLPLIADLFDPARATGQITSALSAPLDFLKALVWILNKGNILRMVEFLTGIGLMAFGLHAAIQGRGERAEGYSTSESAISRSGLGRVSKELASAVVPESRAIKAVKRRRPPAAPHTTRRTALRVRYEREQQVAARRTTQRRQGNA